MIAQTPARGRTINPDLQVAAADLLEALNWVSEDALLMRKVTPYNPEKDPDVGPVAEADELRSFHLPHRQLPSRGQDLWRDLQGFIDARVCDPLPDQRA